MINQITKSRPQKSFFDLNLSNSKSFHSEIKRNKKIEEIRLSCNILIELYVMINNLRFHSISRHIKILATIYSIDI